MPRSSERLVAFTYTSQWRCFLHKKIGTLNNKAKLLKFKKWWEGVTPHNSYGSFFVKEKGQKRGQKGSKRRGQKGEQRLVPGDKSGGGEKEGLGKEKEMRTGQDPPLKKEHSERAQAVAENRNCQDPKGRAIEAPEY